MKRWQYPRKITPQFHIILFCLFAILSLALAKTAFSWPFLICTLGFVSTFFHILILEGYINGILLGRGFTNKVPSGFEVNKSGELVTVHLENNLPIPIKSNKILGRAVTKDTLKYGFVIYTVHFKHNTISDFCVIYHPRIGEKTLALYNRREPKTDDSLKAP